MTPLTLMQLVRAWEQCERWALLAEIAGEHSEAERLRSEAAHYRRQADEMRCCRIAFSELPYSIQDNRRAS